MEVLLADSLGLCFGVRDALTLAREAARPERTAIFGQLVHNPLIQARLDRLGYQTVPESARHALPDRSAILITAHGLGERSRQWLAASGKELVDATCPLVRRAHDAARELAREGWHVVVLGRRDHVEVKGLVEDLPSYDVIESLEEVRELPHARLGVVCQTTTAPAEAAAMIQALRERNPRSVVRVIDTICQPTRDRQEAVDRLCSRVAVVVVVGGRSSNNTRKLLERCRQLGRRAHPVEGPGELERAWFDGERRVGLTAGTSVLPETVEAVRRELASL